MPYLLTVATKTRVNREQKQVVLFTSDPKPSVAIYNALNAQENLYAKVLIDTDTPENIIHAINSD